MLDRLAQLDLLARFQYGLMLVLGSLCLLAALAPIGYELKVAAVSVTFGITVGLWLSHLMTVVLPDTRERAVGE